MNLKTTLALLVAVAVLALLALRFTGDEEGPTLPGTRMLVEGLKGGKVTRFDVLLASRQDASFERRGDEWWMTSPLVDRASPDAVRMLMEALKSNPRLELDPEVDRETLAAVGLEPPRMRVTLWGTDGDPISIRIGERDASGAFTNALVEGDPALYRTGANLVNVLSKGRHEWRDSRFLTGDAALLRRVELSRPGEPRVVLERPGTEWQLAEPSPFQANGAVVGPLVNGLLLLTVDRIAVNDPQEKDLVDRGIADGVAIEVVLDWGARRVVARFGPPEAGLEGGRRYATDSERGHLFLVQGDALAMLETPAEALRDPTLLRVTPATVERFRLTRPGAPTLDAAFDRAEKAFHLKEPFEARIDDSRESALRAWLLAVSSLAATDYLDREELGEAPDGGDPLDVLLADRLGTLELSVADRTGTARPYTLEFADGGDAAYLRCKELAPGTLYVLSREDVLDVLALDPRELLLRDLFPGELIRWREATVTHGGRTRRLVRDANERSPLWRDPAAPEADTSDFQQVLSELENAEVLEVLGRDPEDADGLAGDDAVTLELVIADERGDLGRFTLRFGAVDATGTTVVAAPAGDRSPFPPRTVVRAESWMRQRLLSLFD